MQHSSQRRRFIKATALAGVLAPAWTTLRANASEQATVPLWPTKPIRYVVPFLPGGMGDSMARLLAPPMSERLEQPVMIENRAGGNAMIGYDLVVSAPADGYSWLAITLTHAVNQTLFGGRHLPFSRALRPIARVASSPLVVVVNPDVPAKSLKELVALGKSKPLSAGSSGNGSPPHLGLALLELAGQVDFNHVPYRGGAPSILDLLAGQLDLIVSNHPECIAQIRAGKLRALAVASENRIMTLPDVPTTREQGFPSVLIENWTGLMVGAMTPEHIVTRMTSELAKVVASADMVKKIEALGFSPAYLSGSAFARFLGQETDRWGRIVREKKIQPE
jgi:tripartite-type tricarboxylate transporter receptor subunit TctC